MFFLVLAHLAEDCAAALVILGETFEVLIKMVHDLAFRLGNKTEAPAVARNPGGGSYRKGARIP